MVIDKKLVRLQDLKDAYDKAANKEDVDNKFIEVDNSLSQLSEEIANITEPMNDLEAIEALAECGIITPAYQDGTFYTDANGAIYAL